MSHKDVELIALEVAGARRLGLFCMCRTPGRPPPHPSTRVHRDDARAAVQQLSVQPPGARRVQWRCLEVFNPCESNARV